MSGIIIIFHTKSNTGYAMAPLEKTFFQVAQAFAKDINEIHFGFKDFDNGLPTSLPQDFKNLIAIDNENATTFDGAGKYIREHKIKYAFCFDLQVSSHIGNILRANGVEKIISYWGATISGENFGLKLLIKKLEVLLKKSKPDHFIFESEAMRYFATHGRGIAKNMTSVIPTGIDTNKYHPNNKDEALLTKLFSIPNKSFVIFYSGHMERRKGVHVIVNAAIELADKLGRKDIYFIIAGNKPGEEAPFLNQLGDHKAKDHVIFAGYRTDLATIMPCCNLGVIASTGWDSFPMSSIEMAACGLPLVVSDLQGLKETVEEGVTGLKFPPGDHKKLASLIEELANNSEKLQQFSNAARARIEKGYSTEHQLQNLITCCRKIFK